MGVKKDILLDSGITLSYHNLAEWDIRKDGTGKLWVNSYLDQAARNSGKIPAQVREFDIQLTANDAANATMAVLYTLLMNPGQTEDVPDPNDPTGKGKVPKVISLPGFLAGGQQV